METPEERDKLAAERDHVADERDLRGSVRHRIAGRDVSDSHGEDRREAARDRLDALQDRQAAAQDREAAARDRESASERDSARSAEGAGELDEDGEIGVEPDAIQPPDPDR